MFNAQHETATRLLLGLPQIDRAVTLEELTAIDLAATRNINRSQLREMTGISSATMAKLGRDANVTTHVLIRIYDALEVGLTDIAETVRDSK